MPHKIFIFILLLFLMVPSAPAFAAANEASGMPDEMTGISETALVIVMDISESMKKADPDGQLRNGLAAWVESLDATTHVSLLRYNLNSLEEDAGFYTKGEQGFSNLTARITANMQGTYSDTGAALLKAYERLQNLDKEVKYRSILLVSDDELDIKGKENRTEESSKGDIDKLLSGQAGDMPFDLHFMHVVHGDNANTTLIDTLRSYPSVFISDSSPKEAVDTKLNLLKLFLSDVRFLLLTPKLVDQQWVEATNFPVNTQIELYAYFTLNDALITDLAYLNSFVFTVQNDDESLEMQLAKAQDSFYAPLMYDSSGDHTITVSAKSRSTDLVFTQSLVLTIGTETDIASGSATSAENSGQSPLSSDEEAERIGSSLFDLSSAMNISILLTVVAVFIGLFLYRLSRNLSSMKKSKPIDRIVQLTIYDKNGEICNPFKAKVLKGETVRLSSLIGNKAGSVKLGDIYKINIKNQSSTLQIQNDSLYSCLNHAGSVLEGKFIALKTGTALDFRHAEDLTTIIRLECIDS